MSNAARLVADLIPWYAGLFRGLFGIGGTIVVWLALVSFVLGVSLAIWQRKPRSFAILLTLVVSFVTVAVAGLLRGQVQDRDAISLILWSITAVQIAVGLATLVWAKGGRVATALMVPQCATFWMLSAGVSSMSFENVWL